MALTAELLLRFAALQGGSNDFGGPAFSPELEKLFQFESGAGAGEADLLWMDERTIAASSSEDLDLAGVLTDALGATVTMAEVVAIVVVAAVGNVNNVVLGDATSPVPLLGGTNPTISVKPGGAFVICAPNAAGQFAVGAGTTDDLKVANSGSGSSVAYKIAVLGRSA